MKLTAPQQKALDSLRAGHYCKAQSYRPNTVSTGLNSRVLCSLKDKGLIDFSFIFLGGFVSDLVVHDDLNGFVPIENHDEVLAAEYRRVRLGYGL